MAVSAGHCQLSGSSSGSRPEDATERERQPQRPDTQSQTRATAARRRTAVVCQLRLRRPVLVRAIVR